MKLSIFIPLLTPILLTACATVVRGTSEQVSFTSSPRGALVSTSTGVQCITPCESNVKRRGDFDATFTLNGQRKVVNVNATTPIGVGAAAVVGNAILGGVVGLAVDLGSGALRQHSPNPVHADFDGSGTDPRDAIYTSQCKKNDAAIVGGTAYCI